MLRRASIETDSNALEQHTEHNSMISIVTATFNAEKDLPQLIASLRSQTSAQFAWIVADGGSTDRTIEILESNRDLITLYLPGPDFGIYHALNKAIAEAQTKYYLTLGADDLLHPHAVQSFNTAAEASDADFISAHVRTSEGKMLRPKRGNAFRYGHLAYISQHSVGTLIRKQLHEFVGPYSSRFPIAADRHFILKAVEQFDCTVQAAPFEAGIYSCAGTSSVQHYEALLDIFKVDFSLSKRPLYTALISWIRYGLNLPKMLMK